MRTDKTGDFFLPRLGPSRSGRCPKSRRACPDQELRSLLRQTHRRQIKLMNSQWQEGSAGGKRIELTLTANAIASAIADD